MITSRLDWVIKKTNQWTAKYKPTGDVLTARTQKDLMSEISRYEKEKLSNQ